MSIRTVKEPNLHNLSTDLSRKYCSENYPASLLIQQKNNGPFNQFATSSFCPCDGTCPKCGESRDMRYALHIQPKLKISKPDDPLEIEADKIAEQTIAREYDNSNMVMINDNIHSLIINRKCSKCEDEDYEDKPIQISKKNKSTDSNKLSSEDLSEINNEVGSVISEEGSPLGSRIRALMEPNFGCDFSEVRIHTGTRAVKSAELINANAYTVGHNIVFGEGQFGEDKRGLQLLAHELAHVLQQTIKKPSIYSKKSLCLSEYSQSMSGKSNATNTIGTIDIQRQDKKEEKKLNVIGCKDKEKLISDGVREAKSLSNLALSGLKREYMLSSAAKAFTANFGSLNEEKKNAIISRYVKILGNLENSKFECKKEGKKKKHLCAEGEVHGTRILIYSMFGGERCPKGQVLLHEGSHNAGASGDVDKGEGYPPEKAEDNAYSYEYFSLEVDKEPALPKLRPKKDVRIPTSP